MGFRVILLHLAVAGLSFASLFNPLWGLLGYVWYSLARPDALAYNEGQFQHSILLAICTLAGSWRSFANFRFWIGNPWVLSMILLQVTFVASIAIAAQPGVAWDHYAGFLKYFIICLLIPMFVANEHDFRLLFLVMAFSNALIGSRFGFFGVLHGGVYIETGLGGFISENNTLSLALNTALPLIWFARDLVDKQWQKIGFLIGAFGTMAAIVMSHSRGGLMTLGLVLLFLVYRSRHRIMVAAGLAILILPAVLLVSTSLYDRMATLQNYEEDGSTSARMAYVDVALKVWARYPVLGVGFGTENWALVSEEYMSKTEKRHVVHNNFLQMAVDSGTLAFLVLCWQLFFSAWWLGRAAKRYKELFPGQKDKLAYAYGLQCSLMAFAFGSVGASRTDYDFYYILVMTVGAFYTVHNQLLEQAREKQLAVAAAEPSEAVAVPERDAVDPFRPLPPAVPAAVAVRAPRWRNPMTPIRTRTSPR
ncbi:MAG: putative O-glycosylation ligase, exosortase A system-associated [Bryobacteraceae bacterium]